MSRESKALVFILASFAAYFPFFCCLFPLSIPQNEGLKMEHSENPDDHFPFLLWFILYLPIVFY